jgi:GR25 family glycosyltransferase involved in LPS biosynthesis
MNRSAQAKTLCARLHQAFLLAQPLLWKQTSRSSFGACNDDRIGHVYVINLDRQRNRWRRMLRELRHVRDHNGGVLADLTTRVSAVDALEFGRTLDSTDVVRRYTLGDHLFVDPRSILPPKLDLGEEVEMSRQEVAVAQSHIDVWRMIARGDHRYALVLEDDVRFRSNFSRVLDSAWMQLARLRSDTTFFDVLYVSYKEVDYGAEKTSLSQHVSKLFRGVWCLSGYVISKRGANRLLDRLPIRGPVDLWINHQFSDLDVLCVVKSLIDQRSGEASQNLYSILPALSKIGVLNTEGPGHFHRRPLPKPVFAVGPEGSGLTSVAMALSMLGYRCCSDLESLPRPKLDSLLKNDRPTEFDAYVNIGSLEPHLDTIAERYPGALLIDSTPETDSVRTRSAAWQDRVLRMPDGATDKWKLLCEFVRTVPPACPYPEVEERGQRRLTTWDAASTTVDGVWLEYDESPWVASGPGRRTEVHSLRQDSASSPRVLTGDAPPKHPLVFSGHTWALRSDTFQGNLAMFNPSNASGGPLDRVALTTRKEDMGVRQYSSADLCSCSKYLFGRFSVSLRPPKVSGLVTGVFLHRDSPRQEIDIEFLGNAPNKILVNVFYNPGCEGDRFDYGYRGTPCLIDLGFDFSIAFHEYSLEWTPDEIRWLVDGRIVHARANWTPTPIPHLPMLFHVNIWPTSSRKLAGALDQKLLPASVELQSIQLPLEGE